MDTTSHFIFAGLSASCLVLTVLVIALGVRKREPVDRILTRAQWPLLYALVALSFAFPRTWALTIGGLALIALRASWSFFGQRRSRKSSGPERR